jgi:hypothetical protein
MLKYTERIELAGFARRFLVQTTELSPLQASFWALLRLALTLRAFW